MSPDTKPMVAAAHDDWDRHWQQYAEAAALNPAQGYRRKLVCEELKSHGCSNDARILDIGSGQGDLAVDLRAAFPQARITGLELSAAGVRVAAGKVPDAQFLQRDLLDPGADPGELRGWADYAICSEVLEHLDDPRLLLSNAAEYLAPGCRLVVTVPGGPQSEFDRHIGHRRHYSPEELWTLLTSAGFQVDICTEAGFPFFNLYRATVILRGRRLIEDVQNGAEGSSKWLAHAAMALFGHLFAMNLTGTGMGWQTIAVAVQPSGVGGEPEVRG